MRRVALVAGVLAVLAGCSKGPETNPPAQDAHAEHATPAAAPGGVPAMPALLAGARQLVVVTTRDWNTVGGELRRYQRDAVHEPWRAVGEAQAVVVGRNGLAWDPSIPPITFAPSKQEGDGRSPAGVFALGGAFGLAAPAEAAWLKLPYTQETPSLECVDDPASEYYNQLVDRTTVAAVDWKSSEKMTQVGEAYRWGVVVEYNTRASTGTPQKGKGSCIFLHIGGDEGKGTAGCTAMAAPALDGVMRWLDPAAAPVLVQLPQDVHAAVREAWKLPA